MVKNFRLSKKTVHSLIASLGFIGIGYTNQIIINLSSKIKELIQDACIIGTASSIISAIAFDWLYYFELERLYNESIIIKQEMLTYKILA